MRLTISKDKPIRDIVLNREDLLRHAVEIAHVHAHPGDGTESRPLLPRVADNAKFLELAYQEISRYLQATRDMVPAAEWFLDNYYLLKDLKQQIENNLPRKYEKQLPRVSGSQMAGFPRIFALMVELVEHTDSQLHADTLREFVNAYQSEIPLSSGELWAVPIMLRVALLENIRRLVQEVIFTQREREAAEKWLEPFVHLEMEADLWEEALNRAPRPESYSSAYAERLIRSFRDLGPEGAPILRWFDKLLSKQNTTAEAIAKLEHRRQAMCQVSMGHSITSLRFLAEEDWPRFFEQTSLVDKVLRADPSGTYPRMEFVSRDKYRHAVEKTARRYGVSETVIAGKALELAEEQASTGLPQSHVGYYLLGAGCTRMEEELEKEWGPLRHFWSQVRRLLRRNPVSIYFSSILLGTAALVYLFYRLAIDLQHPGPAMVAVILAALLIPASGMAISLVNWVMTRILPPAFFPKLELQQGIPAHLRTMVVIPTFLSNQVRVRELLAQLEVYFLANNDANLHFALLGDLVDAKTEHLPGDEAVIEAAREGVAALNDKYGADRFYLFNRKRQWNQAEGLWMGWERKRGKLVEFNRLLLGLESTSYNVQVGDLSILPQIRYIITLDADTQLPRDIAKKLIGTIAHPLHTPQLSEDGKRVVRGYGILQPRIGVSLQSGGASSFAKLFSGRAGIDPYTTAVSDVYQDLFGEGSFTGKGIYDVAVFNKVNGNAFPENTVLSHDLLEGIFARTGLVTDIELIDGYPAKYHAYIRRLHRWVRGDWQILPWLFADLPPISRWKIFDNLRRSLEAPALIFLILLAFTVLPGNPWLWTGLGLLYLLLPTVQVCLDFFLKLGDNRELDFKGHLSQFCLILAFLPYQACTEVDAIVRSLVRQFVSHRRMLEWETAADVERRLDVKIGTSWRLMAPSLALVLIIFAAVILLASERTVLFLPLVLLWFFSPWLAYRVSLPLLIKEGALSVEEQAELRYWARKTWAFFEDFIGPDDNWLPPDNVQIEPPNGIAHRTSPTNVGLALLANLAAKDLGYLTLGQVCERIEKTLDTLERMERWKGHFFNWYDTQSLKPLHPLYVSSVDSGNLVIYCITLRSGLQELMQKPIALIDYARALKETFELLVFDLGEPIAPQIKSFGQAIEETLQEQDLDPRVLLKLLERGTNLPAGSGHGSLWAERVNKMIKSYKQELTDFYPWLDNEAEPLQTWDLSLQGLAAHYASLVAEGRDSGSFAVALGHLNNTVKRIRRIQERLNDIAMNTDFAPLYDFDRQLFSIGYRIADQTLDRSFYDLLASEARQASYVAIAKGDIPQSHWFRLGRSLTKVAGKRSLASWSGTMFEFLMPLLVMRNYPGTILDETYRSVVAVQRHYAELRKVPWGISESGFYVFDAQRNYQYKAFGVPGLGLKRGLVQDLVIAPYATFMALMVAPREGLQNLRAMREKGFEGPYGLYEAVDFTAERVPVGTGYGIVQSYMAHHLGMSFLALDNVITGNAMQARFHADALIQASELLLQERIPRVKQITAQPEEQEIGREKEASAAEGRRFVTLNTAESLIPVTHFLSNGQYSVMLTNAGSGFSRLGDIFVSRWREDVTQDFWGMYFYIQNLNSGLVWSAAHQPWGDSGEEYQVTYAPDRVEYYRRDGNIATKSEIVVSPEDNVEIRRISLTNHSQYDRTLEVTSFFEVVLARLNEDLAHPTFNNLFIQTEFTHQTLLATRRPRREGQNRPWLMHTVVVDGEEAGALQYETDRAKFIGRGGDRSRPKALEPNQPLSNSTGAVLDPILSLRQRVRIRPGRTVRISFSIGVGDSREEVLRFAEKYRDVDAVARVFELAWTYSQMELRHLNLSASQANEALNLGGNVLFLSPCRRDVADLLAQNTKGQSSLWPYAISGDMPVILLRVQDPSHLDLVRQFLVVHEYWRLKGLYVDLVILNEEKGGYIQAFQDALRDLVSVGHARELLNRPGGIFLLQRDLVPPEDVTLLCTVARLIFSGHGGSCAVQMRKKGKLLALNPESADRARPEAPDEAYHVVEPSAAALKEEKLLFHNGYGGFSEDGREYVIEFNGKNRTPLPWINVIANPDFGFQVSEAGAGYTWSGNSRENKLTPWSNDPVIDPAGEALYLRDEETGQFWCPTPEPVNGGGPYIIRHGQGYSVFEHFSHGLEQNYLLFVPVDSSVKIAALTLRNLSHNHRRMTATYYAELVMGVARELTAPYLVTWFDGEKQAILFRNTYQEEFAGRLGFLCGLGGKVLSYTGDRAEFIGRNRSPKNPAALDREILSDSVGPGFDPCAAVQLEFSLAAGEEKTVYFLLGEGRDQEALLSLLERYGNFEKVQAALKQVKALWDKILGTVQISTPDKSMDLLMNRWLLYQTIVCRIWARSAFYQSGGAFGFRDQLQDAMALVVPCPQWTRRQIVLHCSHQFVEGDVQHWWHEQRNKGIRTKFSDDLLWLPYVAADYLEHTEDYSILDEQVNFLEDEPLKEDEDERYSIPRISSQSASVYEHCLRAIERGLRFGEHGLPLIGSGDWNDGLSRVGVKGRGESVWLGWFLYLTLKRFARVCDRRNEAERAARYLSEAERLKDNLERHGWDGGWYRRAYFDDGSPMGSARNQECQIDCIAQAWALISCAAKPSRARDAMLALEHYLLRREEGLLLLLTPPFDRAEPDPGYIRGYVPGVRENGGQYTHGAIWAVFAWVEMGEGDKAGELFRLLNPVNHSRTENEAARYKTEPYVMAADVYAIPSQVGRGGWSWYTGAAGWMYQAGLEAILGFRIQGDKLLLKPCIPSNWKEYRIDYRYKGTLYKIQVENLSGKPSGNIQLVLDNVALEQDFILLQDDGNTHEIRCIISN